MKSVMSCFQMHGLIKSNMKISSCMMTAAQPTQVLKAPSYACDCTLSLSFLMGFKVMSDKKHKSISAISSCCIETCYPNTEALPYSTSTNSSSTIEWMDVPHTVSKYMNSKQMQTKPQNTKGHVFWILLSQKLDKYWNNITNNWNGSHSK